MIVTSDVVSLEKRGFYQGMLGGVVAIANSLGPLVGGAFSEKVSWRWCFYINIPLSSIAILVVAFVLPFKKVSGDIRGKLAKIDYVGSFFMFTSAILVLLALSWGGTSYPWSSAGSIAPLVIGTTLAVFYQVVRGDSPIRSGVMLLPLVLVQTVTSFTAGALVSKTGNYQLNLWVGFAIWTIALGLLSTVSPTISNAKLVGYQILNGIGAGQTFQTSLIAIQASVKRNEMAVATATRNFLRLLGGTIALAACAAILNNTTK
ncbi:hypothetical protein SCUCBS95973_009880 [Sporothrix curviconia]|uniref:Major facilitator superfamily (MFS) profile domain-containing protein n=1 Tax=Sporothrix curviconia TaxID=1260050 RepID=A0ABP0CZK7_9PEZI